MTSRSGAALIIAIVVLAAMLLLGLPFLFTQSGSLSGIRSYSHSQLANVGQDSAQSMGIAAGSSAARYHWQQGGVVDGTTVFLDDWSDLFYSLGADDPASGLRRAGGAVNRLEFDTRNHRFALPGDPFFADAPVAERDALRQRYPTVVGLMIEDEAGKLDPNHLDIGTWSRLLQHAGIADWTDGPPADDPGRMQIARALAKLRYRLPGGRITAIDQLLLAEPPTPVVSSSNPTPRPRRGLTRAELERLRPYLTLANPAPARGGLIDLGTVIGVDGTLVTIDHDQPGALLAFPPAPLLVGAGTGLRVSDGDESFAMPALGEAPRQPAVGAAVGIEAPPVVNLHQAEQPVRQTFAPGQLPSPTPPAAAGKPPTPSLLTELQSFPALGVDALQRAHTAFNLTAPLVVTSKVGSTHVLCSRDTDPVPGPFDSLGQSIDPDFPLMPEEAKRVVLHRNATVIRVVTGSLDRFPTRGYAIIKGVNADTNAADQELIHYTSTVLPLSTAVAATQLVTLVDVVRGVDPATGLPSDALRKNFHSGTDSTRFDKPADLHLDALATIEQHPVGIASHGVISIASTSTVTDPVGNQTAQEQHRVVAQALPQETALEARWDKQASLHALLAQRHGSLMTSFPRPHPRLSNVMPQDAANVTMPGNVRYEPPLDVDDLDGSVGLRPAVMRTLLSLNDQQLRRDWTLSFGGTAAGALKVNGSGTEPIPTGGAYTAADITPEGLRLSNNRVLKYPNPSNGFLRDSHIPFNPSTANSGLLSPIHGRQFSLWVRPDATWDKEVTLVDMQMPDGVDGNVSERLTGQTLQNEARDGRAINQGDAKISNRFRLFYDPGVKQLVLVLNPGSIPHAADYGPPVPRQTYGPTNGIPLVSTVWPSVNPECLGGTNNASMNIAMASAPPVVDVQHRYFVGNQFQRGQWHLVQVAFSSSQPGGMAIIVDGLVGRDVTRTPDDLTAMTIPGDHMTHPSLVLDEALETEDQVEDVGTRALYVNSISLKALAWDGSARLTGELAVRRLLPERGLVRIGREYISYQWIDENGALRDCVRARRQRTHADQIGTGHGFHRMEAHTRGALVYPGGFAFSLNQNVAWWRGGCHLAEPMPDGDPTHKHQVWARTAIDIPAPMPPVPAPDTILLSGTAAIIAQFPPRGWIRFENGQQVYYDNEGVRPIDVDPPSLLNLHHRANVTTTNPDGSTQTKEEWVPGLRDALSKNQELVLISQEITGKDPTTNQLIDPTQNNTYASGGLIQLYDARPFSPSLPNGGRAEWISYTEIRSRTDYPVVADGTRVSFLINVSEERLTPTSAFMRGGFWFTDGLTPGEYRQGARARERTAFAPTDLSNYDGSAFPNAHTFDKITTRVIPVQTNLEIAYLLEAGDVVTLMPKIPGPQQRPIQLCVRYSADDAFREDFPTNGDRSGAAISAWNSTNKHFAFTEAIPLSWNNTGNTQFQLLCWPCWTPEDDLSQLNSPSEWRRARLGWVLPWANSFAPDFRPDNGTPGNRTVSFLTSEEAGPGALATIDAIQAGEQPGWQEGNQAQANIIPPSAGEWLGASALNGPLEIRTDQPIFFRSHGLIEIGGEVFAYKTNFQQDEDDVTAPMNPDPVRNNQAWIIGRALLGSVMRRHVGPELVLHLPVGPVSEVVDGLVDASGPVNLEGGLANATVLLTARNGEEMELASLPNRHTAPWLRGLYNTTPVAWAARGENAATIPSLAPLAIAWWPRYPSVYPTDMLASDTVAEYLRCRSYAWAGFPLRFHDCLFTGQDNGGIVNLSDDDGFFQLYSTALDGSLDWDAVPVVPRQEPPGTGRIDISDVFDSDRFRAPSVGINRWLTPGTVRPTDGAELRLFWLYRGTLLAVAGNPIDWLLDAADHGNRAPMLGPAYLRTRAPNKVLNVER